LDFAKKRRFPWRAAITGLAGILLILGVLVATLPSAQRGTLNRMLVSSLIKGSDGSGNARLAAHLHAIDLARESNWLGVGLGASYRYWMQTRPNDPNAVPEAGQMGHELIMSIWGQLLAEGGIPALLAYAAGAFFLVTGLFRRWRQGDDPFVSGSLAASTVFFFFIAFFLGNVARGDVWVWFAIWSRMALPDAGETLEEKTQRT
jgi:O-antigen ligase